MVPVDASYRVDGPHIRRSPVFRLGAAPGDRGAAVALGGGVLVWTNAGTSATPRAGTSNSILPTWREAPAESRAMPPAVGATLWSARF